LTNREHAGTARREGDEAIFLLSPPTRGEFPQGRPTGTSTSLEAFTPVTAGASPESAVQSGSR
jgi:hypothetical protein